MVTTAIAPVSLFRCRLTRPIGDRLPWRHRNRRTRFENRDQPTISLFIRSENSRGHALSEVCERATTGWTSTGGARSRSAPRRNDTAEHKPRVQSTRSRVEAEIAPWRRPGIPMVKCEISTSDEVVPILSRAVPVRFSGAQSGGMTTLTRILITALPLLCALGVLGAPAAAHPSDPPWPPVNEPSPGLPTEPPSDGPSGQPAVMPPADSVSAREGRAVPPFVTPVSQLPVEVRVVQSAGVPVVRPPVGVQPGVVPSKPRSPVMPSCGGSGHARISPAPVPERHGEARMVRRAPCPGTAPSPSGPVPPVVPAGASPRPVLTPAPVRVQVSIVDLAAAPPASPDGPGRPTAGRPADRVADPAPVPVRVSSVDLADSPWVSATRPGRPPAGRSTDRTAGHAPVSGRVDAVVRSSGSADGMPVVLRDLLQAWVAQQRVQPLRPHR